ncbi:MAG: GGDEF domain-containing protein [Fervidobacterium sp.]
MSPSYIKIVGSIKGVSYTFQSESLVVIIYYFSLLPKELELIELIIDTAKTHIKSIMEHNKVLRESFFDSLSGAYNRQTGLELLSKIFLSIKREVREGYLVFLDIDNLKKYNDNFGHAKGDELIKNFSQAVLKSIRKNDIFVRYGGDEFLLYIDSKEPENVIRRIKLSNDAEFSYGIVSLHDFDTLEDAIIAADSKMYELKNAKRFHNGLRTYRNI